MIIDYSVVYYGAKKNGGAFDIVKNRMEWGKLCCGSREVTMALNTANGFVPEKETDINAGWRVRMLSCLDDMDSEEGKEELRQLANAITVMDERKEWFVLLYAENCLVGFAYDAGLPMPDSLPSGETTYEVPKGVAHSNEIIGIVDAIVECGLTEENRMSFYNSLYIIKSLA